MEIEEKKSDLMDRISHVENPVVLQEIERILDLSDTFTEEQQKQFDLQVTEGLTLEEFRQEMHKRIKSWDWKK